MEWYLKVVMDNYFNFQGRARRKEYWMFVLVNIIAVMALSLLEVMVGLRGESIGLLSGLYSIAIVLPYLGVTVRRLHDTDRSGWWILIGFVPLIGALILLYFYVSDSQEGPNRFGANPKGVEKEEFTPQEDDFPPPKSN